MENKEVLYNTDSYNSLRSAVVRITKTENEEIKLMALKLYEDGMIVRPTRHQFMLYAVRSVMEIVRRQNQESTGTGDERETKEECGKDDKHEHTGVKRTKRDDIKPEDDFIDEEEEGFDQLEPREEEEVR